MLHLAINSGTDLALFNALLTYVAEQGWLDQGLHRRLDTGFDEALAANKTASRRRARSPACRRSGHRQGRAWIAEPKEGGKRGRTMFAYEKGLIWGNDNYRTNGALVNLALATGNIGRPGGGCVRMGGHQEGYSRPSDAHVGRPAAYVDKLLIEGKGGVHHIWGCDHYKTTLNALEFKRVYKQRTDLVKDAMNAVPSGDRAAMVEAIMGAIRRAACSRSTSTSCRPRSARPATSGCRRRDLGRDEPDLDERRAAHAADRALHGPARPGDARLPDRGADRQPPGARVPRAWATPPYADQFKGFDWQTEEDAFMDGYHQHAEGRRVRHLRAPARHGHQRLPGAGHRLRGRQDRRHQARLYADGKFGTEDGKGHLHGDQWRGLQAPGKQEQKDKFPFLINNGRANHVWQSAYLDQENEFVMDRWPYPFLEMHPEDMAELGVKAGDLVEVYNDAGSTQAMVYPTPTAKRKETFMLFAYPTGVQGNVVNAGVNEFIIPNYKQTALLAAVTMPA